jgi:DNA-binding XRE family transcriptional regulator
MAKNSGMKPAELKEARARLGFTHEQLAIELSVHRLSVIRWEAGTHRIPLMLKRAIKELARRHVPSSGVSAPQ